MEITPLIPATYFTALVLGSSMTPTAVTSVTYGLSGVGSDSSWTNRQNQSILFSRLIEIQNECSCEAWDAECARPISHKTLGRATEVITAIPFNMEIPDVTPQADGEISFAWYQDRHHQVILTIGESTRVSYAGIDGSQKFWGYQDLSSLSDLLDRIKLTFGLTRVPGC